MRIPHFPLISLARSQLAQGASALLDLALPPVCRLCSQPAGEGHDFCSTCHTAVSHSEPMMREACRKCGFPQPRLASAVPLDPEAMGGPAQPLPLSGDVGGEGTSGAARRRSASQSPEPAGWQAAEPEPKYERGCAACRRLEFEFDGVVPLWIYQDRVRDAVVAAKFAHRSPLGDALGRRLGQRVRETLPDDLPELVTFVPSHVTRQIGRGGTGTQVIAQAVAQTLGVRCQSLLKTTRRIAKQAWLDDHSRMENVRGAFRLKRGYAFAKPPEIANQHILLVEDVLTTGATANEVAGVLCEGNARRVTLAVVARAIRAD